MKKLAVYICILFVSCFVSEECYGDDNIDIYFDYVGLKQGIDPDLLRAISIAESKMNPLALNCRGKSYSPRNKRIAFQILRKEGLICDIGIMQVNYKYNGYRKQVSVSELLDVETNISVAAGILKENMVGTSNAWVAVGRYHTWKDKGRSVRYANRVRRIYIRLKQEGV